LVSAICFTKDEMMVAAAAGWRVAGGFQVVVGFVAAIYFTQRRKDAKRWVAAE